MTTKILSGTIVGGYTLAAAYTGVSVTGTGALSGSAGADPGGGGGVGLTLPTGGTAINRGRIDGGAGAHGQNAAEIYNVSYWEVTSGTGNGGDGAAGVVAAAIATVSNLGTVAGGSGGDGGYGWGGYKAADSFPTPGQYRVFVAPGDGGGGGAGLDLNAGGKVVNDGLVTGGSGGAGSLAEFYTANNPHAVYGAYSFGGNGGAGVALGGPGTVINNGTIIGGTAFVGRDAFYNGARGDGVFSNGGGTIVNGAATDQTAVISGGYGVRLVGPGEVVNWGTIEGTSFAIRSFGAGCSLIGEGGSTFIGTVFGSGGSLQLDAGGQGTIGAVDGFGTISVQAGAAWIETGTMDNYGACRQGGILTLAGGSILNSAGAAWMLSNGILVAAGDSGTFTNAGTLVRGNVTTANNIAADFVNTNTGVIEIGSGTLFLDGLANSLNGSVTGAGTLGFGGGVSTLQPGLVISTAAIALKGAATEVLLDENLTFSGVWNQAAGTVSVASGHTLTLIGSANRFSGTVTGAGTLGFGGGVSTLGPGLTLTTAAVAIKGATTSVLLDESLTAVGGWTQSGGTVSVDSGDTLKITGTGDSFSGTITGAGTANFAAGSDSFKTLTLSTAHTAIGAAHVTMTGAIVVTGLVVAMGSSLTVAAIGAALTGGGTLQLMGTADIVTGATATAKLSNADRIVGAGHLGGGAMVLSNLAAGVIDGTGALTLDTGAQTIVNAGLIEATGVGAVTVASAVNNTGVLEAAKGTLTVNGVVTGAGKLMIENGGVADFTAAFSENVTFAVGGGVLELAHSQAYGGTITGFANTGAELDPLDIAFGSKTKATYSGTTASGVLTVTDGTHTAKIHLAGNFTGSTWTLTSDGHGGTTVVDPLAARTAGAAPLASAMAGFAPAAAAASQLPAACSPCLTHLLAAPRSTLTP
jgi:hypothetical protein